MIVRFSALKTRAGLSALVILFLWPTFNILVIAVVRSELGVYDVDSLMSVAVRLYLSFAIAFLVKEFIETRFPASFPGTHFGRQLALYVLAFSVGGIVVVATTPEPTVPEMPRIRVIPLLFLFFEMLVFVAAITILAQRERNQAMALNLKQAQINLLRSQINPHFLFNTLNLLASEIARSPETAQEIVYDLADLLRDSMKAGERAELSIGEEVGLATQYLQLQEKRFPDRFSFAVHVDPEVSQRRIPALLLQPGVENAIKHGVAKTRARAHLDITAKKKNGDIELTVANTGGLGEAAAPKPGDGFRILSETLDLYYPGRHAMDFERTEHGAVLSIRIPARGELQLVHG
ncbi:MAG: histidine kinase [Pseudomonadota bacterium]